MEESVAQTCGQVQGVDEMKRKERMGVYIEQICKMLQHLPTTYANEIECLALRDNIALSHHDIAQKLNIEVDK